MRSLLLSWLFLLLSLLSFLSLLLLRRFSLLAPLDTLCDWYSLDDTLCDWYCSWLISRTFDRPFELVGCAPNTARLARPSLMRNDIGPLSRSPLVPLRYNSEQLTTGRFPLSHLTRLTYQSTQVGSVINSFRASVRLQGTSSADSWPRAHAPSTRGRSSLKNLETFRSLDSWKIQSQQNFKESRFGLVNTRHRRFAKRPPSFRLTRRTAPARPIESLLR